MNIDRRSSHFFFPHSSKRSTYFYISPTIQSSFHIIPWMMATHYDSREELCVRKVKWNEPTARIKSRVDWCEEEEKVCLDEMAIKRTTIINHRFDVDCSRIHFMNEETAICIVSFSSTANISRSCSGNACLLLYSTWSSNQFVPTCAFTQGQSFQCGGCAHCMFSS